MVLILCNFFLIIREGNLSFKSWRQFDTFLFNGDAICSLELYSCNTLLSPEYDVILLLSLLLSSWQCLSEVR